MNPQALKQNLAQKMGNFAQGGAVGGGVGAMMGNIGKNVARGAQGVGQAVGNFFNPQPAHAQNFDVGDDESYKRYNGELMGHYDQNKNLENGSYYVQDMSENPPAYTGNSPYYQGMSPNQAGVNLPYYREMQAGRAQRPGPYPQWKFPYPIATSTADTIDPTSAPGLRDYLQKFMDNGQMSKNIETMKMEKPFYEGTMDAAHLHAGLRPDQNPFAPYDTIPPQGFWMQSQQSPMRISNGEKLNDYTPGKWNPAYDSSQL